MRIGTGFDVHRLVEGRKLVLGGVEIPHETGLEGHSDADVILHAVMDAVLGALALGDIGHHFPNTDETWRGASSMTLASHVSGLMRERHFLVGNLDVMVMAEAPKIAPHIPEMRRNIAAVFGCKVEDVSIKATTMEHLGFVGRREGITAQAMALLKEESE